tara:strand:+ start:8230 stop:10020 length:1791 start_codon:yes stop_codon:yes gene_type:complete
MAGRTLDLESLIQEPDILATAIAVEFVRLNQLRSSWLAEKKELRNYIFATDTSKTSNVQLPWKNSTTLPKLTQIRDNLHANYMAALFPNDEWLDWLGDDEDAEAKEKKNIIKAYMMNKNRQSGFINTVSEMVYDFIDSGNVIATTEYVNETREFPEGSDQEGELIPGYVGPRAVRLHPFDVVFNPTAVNFEQTPKIFRVLKTMGELATDIEDHPEWGFLEGAFDQVKNARKNVTGLTSNDVHQNEGYQIDGFGSYLEYLNSGYVEILEFHGDLWDVNEEELLKNHIITVVDRRFVLRKVPNPSWRGSSIRHAGWRLRPGNLWAMGPLDNLVGMQYRLDHLENLKADVFDQIAHPITKVQGFVEDWEDQPGARIYLGDEGDVEHLRPDTTALNADFQIQQLMVTMEEMAGAPKNAMGIRTPGEKTKFEVQTLDNASGRIFQNKVAYFERQFLEPLLNDMLELARRNMDTSDVVRVVDDEFGAALFQRITPEDLRARGKIRPIGARHFATKANQMQNLINMMNSPIGADPAVNTHISGLKMAQVMEDLLDIEKFGMVIPNIRVAEQLETQKLIDAGSQDLDDTAAASGTAPSQEEPIA